MGKKIVWLFDCDGTLLNDRGEITPETRNVIRKLAENPENYLIFASGRSYAGVEKVCSQLNMLDDFKYYICFTGCEIFESGSKKVLFNRSLNWKDTRRIATLAKRNNIPCYIMCQDLVLSEQFIDEAKTESERNLQSVVYTNLLNARVNAMKVVLMAYCESESLQEEYTIIHPSNKITEFLPKNTGKSQAMLKLKNDIIHADYIVSFGDAGNDYDMIKDADFGFVWAMVQKNVKKLPI